MKCPSCNENLVISERQGIEIDYCTQCRGIWLDRGELDKILERSSDGGNKSDNYRYGQKKRKKEGFLSELFDF